MPKSITVYRVFIGSPGGLEAERQQFRDTLHKFSRIHARHHDVEFEPVGWEDTLPGKGRPQAKINEDLEQCDYAVFAFHDRWGSPTGNGNLVGTEEEWAIAERLYGADGGYKIRQMTLYFKSVPAAQAKDPGEEFKKVLAFKAAVFSGKQHLCGKFENVNEFAERIEEHLSAWLAHHVKPVSDDAVTQPNSPQDDTTAVQPQSKFTPDFSFWMGEARMTPQKDPTDHSLALSHLTKALALAQSDNQIAGALFSKGYRLGALDRSAEAIAVYDELISRFGTNNAAAIQILLAGALFNKGCRLSALERGNEAITVYDELINRFNNSDSASIKQQVAKSLINKGFALGLLNQNIESIAVYDDLISRFNNYKAVAIQDQVAKALFNKGNRLAILNRSTEAIIVFDELVERFGTNSAAAIQFQIAKALFSKGITLGALDRDAEAIVAFDELIGRFGKNEAAEIQARVARALFRKGLTLGTLGRSDEAISVYNELIARFGENETAEIQDQVARALLNKGYRLGVLGRSSERAAVYDELINSFGMSNVETIRESVSKALFNKACALAIEGLVPDCIETLDQWGERRGSIDCNAIANDSDFDRVRSVPEFVEFLKAKGC